MNPETRAIQGPTVYTKLITIETVEGNAGKLPCIHNMSVGKQVPSYLIIRSN